MAVPLFVLAAALTVMGMQSVVFAQEFGPRVTRANAALLELLTAPGREAPAGADSGEHPYNDLLADLEDPPWYLWPTSSVLPHRSSLEEALRFNAATYLAQSGERGTARVMLAGLHASAHDPQRVGLINFSLGRLYFELFRDRPSPESLARAVEYLRQSVRADTDAPLARRLLGYLTSLEQAGTSSEGGQANSNNTGDGERPAEVREVLEF